MVSRAIARLLLVALVASPVSVVAAQAATAGGQTTAGPAGGRGPGTATPIKHLVVIFQENVWFDHYFGTYPNATNPAEEPAFHAAPGTPARSLAATDLRSEPWLHGRAEGVRHGTDGFVQNTDVESCAPPDKT
jgi:phospholipase C